MKSKSLVLKIKEHPFRLFALFTLFMLSLLVFFVGSQKVSYADSTGLSVSPPLQRFDLNPGDSAKQTFHVSNPTDTTTKFHVYSTPYSVIDDAYTQDFISPSAMTEISKWIHFDQITYDLNPGTSIDITYTVDVPNTAHGGGQYAAIMVESDAPTVKSTGIAEITRIASLVYTKVAGDISVSGNLMDEKLDSVFKIGASIDSSYKIQNTGNVEMLVPHKLKIENAITKSVVSDPNNIETSTLPNTIRSMKEKWDSNFAVGLYKVTQEVNVAGKITQNSKTVFLISYPVFVCLLVVLAILLVLLVRKIMIMKGVVGKKRPSRKKGKNVANDSNEVLSKNQDVETTVSEENMEEALKLERQKLELRQKELDLKEKELKLKSKDSDSKDSDNSANDNSTNKDG
jgi:hypothetical protein